MRNIFFKRKGREEFSQRSQRVIKSGFNFAYIAHSLLPIAIGTLRLILKYLISLIITLCWWSYHAYSQDILIAPVLTLVTVQPESGKTVLNWILSPSSNVAAYVIYTYHDENGTPRGDVVDTVWNSSATTYIYNIVSSNSFSSSYVVAAYRLPEIPGAPRTEGYSSEFSNILNTIFTKAEIDTCNNKIVLSWNSYPSSPKAVTGYSVLVSLNGSALSEAANVSPETGSFTLNDFVTDAGYCFIIRANLEGGAISTSNKACLNTRMQRTPAWINADYATVNTDKRISLSFTYDQSSEISNFILERKSGISGSFAEIAQPVSTSGSVIYTDDKADISTINYYRLAALNNCNNPVRKSNLCSNMVLNLEKNGENLSLGWNSYKEWSGLIDSYRLFANTGTGYSERVVLPSSDTSYTMSYREIMNEVAENQVCFYIYASEISNPHGIRGESKSSLACIAPDEVITVPNIFIPGKGSVNSVFRPVLSFTPLEYHLVISDRQSKVIFETYDHNHAWDGTRGGSLLPQDVYMWFLKVTTPSGKTMNRTGTVTTITGN
jgi:hypothetical protein